jgi:hypothetical protein
MDANTNIVFTNTEYKNTELFKCSLTQANKIFGLVFGNTYNYGEFSGDAVVIGCIKDIPVCAAVIEYKNEEEHGDKVVFASGKQALISSVASYPPNNGHGTLLMTYIINHLEVNKIILNININDNSDRLIHFYSKFGFDIEIDADHSIFPYYEHFEFRMFRMTAT